jgi:hypothetical protein
MVYFPNPYSHAHEKVIQRHPHIRSSGWPDDASLIADGILIFLHPLSLLMLFKYFIMIDFFVLFARVPIQHFRWWKLSGNEREPQRTISIAIELQPVRSSAVQLCAHFLNLVCRSCIFFSFLVIPPSHWFFMNMMTKITFVFPFFLPSDAFWLGENIIKRGREREIHVRAGPECVRSC